MSEEERTVDMNFKEALQTNMLVGDGAMGTYLYEAGYTGSFEALNLTEPAVIKKVHREYVESGADVIQTNTYRANRVMLQKYEIEEKVEAINQAAVRIAKEAVGRDAYVVGTIGGIKGVQPIDVSDTEIEKALVEQAKALLSEHPDGLLFETFYDIEELTAAIRNVRQFSDTVIIAQVALEEVGVMKGGLTVQDVFEQLKEAGADVVGLNCGMGPYHIHRSFESVPLMEEVYFSAYPNASLPELEEGRFVYQSNPDYFYEKAGDLKKQGVRLIGGCCGTTPAHIREIARALKGTTPIKEKTFVVSMEEPMEWKEKEPALPLNDTSPKTKVIVELDQRS